MSTRRPDIQGLRAIAVLMVVLFHAHLPVPGGFTGVDVFFVISGFVITAMLRREWDASGRLAFGQFYLRRFLRLSPALALTVVVVAALSAVLLSPFGPQQTMAATGLGAMLMAANFVIAHAAGDYFAVTATHNPLLNTWSLSVEEQFYLFFPALLAAGWLLALKRGRRNAVAVALVGAATLGSFLLSLTWSHGGELASGMTTFFGGPSSFAFYGPLSRVWEFGVGALLALAVSSGFTVRPVIARNCSIGGIVLIALSAFVITDVMPFPGFIALVPVLGTALVILGGTGHASVVTRALSLRPAVTVGDWSYSWYLWHWPLIVFAGLLIPNAPWALIAAAALSLVPALLSYRFVEQPLRHLRTASRSRLSLTIGLTALLPITACLALLWAANSGWGGRFTAPPTTVVEQPTTPSATTTASPAPVASEPELIAGDGAIAADTTTGDLRAQHAAVKAGCVNTDVDDVACRFGPSPAKGTVLMLGDSQAYALADGVINAATELGYDTVVSSRTGCPFLGRSSSGAIELPCRPWQKAALEYALTSHPALVVIANRSGGYVHPELKWRTAATDAGDAAATTKEAASLWRTGLDGVVGPISDAGIPVVIISAVPEMPEFSDQRSLFSQAFGSQAYEIAREDAVAFRTPADEAEARVAQAHPRVWRVDPIPALCDAERCLSAVDGVLRYQDETHLTVDGSLLLTPEIKAILGEALSGTATAQ